MYEEPRINEFVSNGYRLPAQPPRITFASERFYFRLSLRI